MSTLSFSTDSAASLASGVASPSPLTATSSTASGPSRPDPNYNPPFFNDVQFIDRGWWRNVAHFAKKHYSEGLVSSTYQHLLSHLEFGACLADYPALKGRYNRIRQLEDIDDLNGAGHVGQGQARIRFVNYYTVSTGIPKEPPAPKRTDLHLRPESVESQQLATGSSGASTPRISVEDYSDGERPQTLQILDPVPEPDSEPEEAAAAEPLATEETSKNKTPPSPTDEKTGLDRKSDPGGGDEAASTTQPQHQEEAIDEPNNDLPLIPPVPEAPEAPNLEKYTDKDARKQAEKEFKRVQKTYDQAIKDREKAIKERQKLVEKRRKKAQKEAEKRQKEEDKRQREEDKRLAREQKEQAAQRGPAQDDTEQSGARAQVVTAAQAQALQRQLTDLALRDQVPGTGCPGELSPQTTRGSATVSSPPAADDGRKKKKEEKLHKFCMVPQKDSSGARDSCWVQVRMEGVDEVGAHCGLFFPGPHYEKIVGDVGSRIVGWTQEDMSMRAILALD